MFDNICKFLAENFPDDLTRWLLGSPMSLTELKPTELSLEPIRADSLILLQSDDLVLHTEFQTEPDAKIPFRMLDYRVRVYRRFPHKQMRQVVVYLSKTNSPLVQVNQIELENTYHRFEVIRLWEQPTEQFLSRPGLFPFAVLSQTESPDRVLTQIARAVSAIPDKSISQNIAAASAILAGLVLDREVIRQIIRSEIMQESVIYQQIKLEGKEEGIVTGKLAVAKNLLNMGMSVEQVAQATELSVEQILHLQTNNHQNNS